MGEAACDVVTQIQEGLDRLSVSLFSTAGALQRDAHPVSVRGEPVAPINSQVNSRDLAAGWAHEVAALSKAVDELIQNLPDVNSTDEEELKRVATAIQENNEAGEVLRAETAQVEGLLGKIRSLYAAVADAQLIDNRTT